MIHVGATGRLVQGDVLDSNKEHLERALKAYDPQLYLRWNVKKRKGLGVWELRRRPNEKTATLQGYLPNGQPVLYLDYKEVDIENHVKDVPILGYDLVEWVKRCDQWAAMNYEEGQHQRVDSWLDQMDAGYDRFLSKTETTNQAEAVYGLKQERGMIRDYKDAILSGTNPASIARWWK